MDTFTLLAVGVTVGSAEIAQVKSGKGFTMKPVIAGFVLGTVLFVISAVNPGLGTAFAALAMVFALLRNGSAFIGAANSVVASSK